MANQKLLGKKYKIENGVVVIEETVEKTLTKEELLREAHMYEMQQGQLKAQMDEIKKRYDELETAKQEVIAMANEFPVQETPKI